MLYFGLCCLLKDSDIKFKSYTKKSLLGLSFSDSFKKVVDVCTHNIETLQKMLNYCKEMDIYSYRISSDLFPHWDYISKHVLGRDNIDSLLSKLSNINTYNITLSLHPGQHVNLGSPSIDVVNNSIADLNYHKIIADCLGFKEINIHLGGSYGDKQQAKSRFIENVRNLFPQIIPYLTIENDELNYNLFDCYEVSQELGCRTTFDIHHEKCYNLKEKKSYDLLSLIDKIQLQWVRKGYDYMRMHLSNPRDGYTTSSKSRPHSDMIESNSLPDWLFELSKRFDIHLDIEAKFKQKAIFQLRENFKEIK